jgi:SAM-dependent methyltransferase
VSPMDSNLAERQEVLFYSKSDEKFTVRALLDDLLGERQFDRALDVGCGPGHITEPLARRTRQLVLMEKMPQFEESLKRQFPNAKVIVSDFRETQPTGKFDVILFAHVLYYQPAEQWLEICKSMLELLTDEGELVIVLNSDSGDWWKILNTFSRELKPHIGFHYKPLSSFKRELSAIAKVQSFPYRFQVWADPAPAAWADFVGKEMLEIADENVLREKAGEFAEFAKHFKQIDGSAVMDFRAELLRLRK